LSPVDGAPLDLTFAALRSVSPVHLQYMRNMGTLAALLLA
jgi:light-regulated signal transduction histidine kinase (bacteriophytochrome)